METSVMQVAEVGSGRSGSAASVGSRSGGLSGLPLLAMLAVLLVLVPVAGPNGGAGPATALVADSTTTSTVCNAASLTPSAVSTTTSNPSGNLTVGGSVSVTLEIEVANYTNSFGAITAEFPSLTATFPLTSTKQSLTLFAPPRVLTVASTGWTSPSAANATFTRVISNGSLPGGASNVSFNSSQSARLSSSKLAVMANTWYSGGITLELRWHWTVVSQAQATPTVGNWTVPSPTAKSPNLPTEFYPAPLVTLGLMTPFPAVAGTNFTLDLLGRVNATSFRLVVEYPTNGTNVRSQYQNNTGTGSSFAAMILLARSGGTTMPPGDFLLHVHDACGAIIHSLSIIVTNDTVSCNQHTVAPASLSIPLNDPPNLAKKPVTIKVQYQVRIVNYTSSLGQVTITLPGAKAVFPTTSPAGGVSVRIAASTLKLGGGAWSSNIQGSTVVNQNVAFTPKSTAYLTTDKIAVMASGLYNGKLTLEFRWMYQVSGEPKVSWTTPSYSYGSPYLPTIFYPAPYVSVLANTSSPATSGTNYTMELGGAVKGTTFRTVVEYPSNGTELRHQFEFTSPNATTFNATILLKWLRNNVDIPPGNYLVHIHDVCDAIIHSIPVTVVAANGSNSSSSGGLGGVLGSLGSGLGGSTGVGPMAMRPTYS